MNISLTYLDGQSDVSVGTKAPSPVARAVVEASSWDTENPLNVRAIRLVKQVTAHLRSLLFKTTINSHRMVKNEFLYTHKSLLDHNSNTACASSEKWAMMVLI